MAKKNNQDEEIKTPEENPETEITYSSEPDSSESMVTKEPEAKKEEEIKTPEEKAIEASKPYKDKDGNFWENGLQKYYLKHKTRKQVEKKGILIFEDTGHECHYHLNLLPAEVKRRQEKGEIF